MKLMLWAICVLATYGYLAEAVQLSASLKQQKRDVSAPDRLSPLVLVLSWVMFIGLATVLFVVTPGIFSGAILVAVIFALIMMIAIKLGTQKRFSVDRYILLWLKPINARLVKHLNGPLSKIAKRYVKVEPRATHTGLYDKPDLLGLISKQAHQPDNNILEQDLALVRHALTFGDKKVEDLMVPIASVRKVQAEAEIGPHLMDELHKVSRKFIPVVSKNSSKKIVGILYEGDLLNFSEGGKVGNVMSKNLAYIDKDKGLALALNQLLNHSTKVLLVTDQDRVVGLLYESEIIKQLLGAENSEPGSVTP